MLRVSSEDSMRRTIGTTSRRSWLPTHPTYASTGTPDSLLFEGRDAIRERFGKMFASSPQLHATVEARITQGDKVVWKETATGMAGGRTNTAIFVWEVKNNLITKVMVIP